MTFAIFHGFQGLENGLPKFHDFPWPGGTLVVAVMGRMICRVRCGWGWTNQRWTNSCAHSAL